MTPVSLQALQAALGGELAGDVDRTVDRISPLASAGPQSISFVTHPRYRAQLEASTAACVIVSPAMVAMVPAGVVAWVVPDPYLHFARLTQWWARQVRPGATLGVHATAVVADDVVLGEQVSIGPMVVIEPGSVIGDGAVIGAQCCLGRGTRIGAATRLAPRVTLMDDVHIGQRCLIHSGAVLGADGFGFAPQDGRWIKIEQLGGVRVGDDVEIGANTCIDRGALEHTVIGEGVKLDNQIQIGHNVHIGAHSAMAGCVGVAGSTRIGSGCTVGGAGMILGHLEIADGVHISAASVVMRSITRPGQYTGIFPIDENGSWEKNAASLRQLHVLRDRIRALEKKTQP
ncbi:UDP-3-O-[3-hydroxymyristoyl] glucosamine N-acyltransferase [Sphaerotilus hippei]|uniref:UDP-3-O-acylglucosamine N-acyltransferase n=1 Tax=Sphaerotilus hippei TaxID=744406 RepID=A0A318H4N3_9BURK|nr:UDP-3-O-(3-hydroxymyristoyl)glucosamine N-acyltransferase [Sphaerotilus hippei]PXW98656.1 UDP-3-O-[3-hydroxymyristoyl] glucosamine N-acyltransferase [Sphaerotilus hippei]